MSEIYAVALDALLEGLGVSRSSILLFDPDGIMRFKAWRNLSAHYRQTVEGHSPWTPEMTDAEALVVPDVRLASSLAPYLPAITSEGIAAMAFIPLISRRSVIGKFMLYYDQPRVLDADELQLAGLIASQVAFAVERTRTEAEARRSETRLRYALDAALMGTWDWDLVTSTVRWSDNLERLHGRMPGTFDGTFASYERQIHPEDRGRVLAALHQSIVDGAPYEVEYRIVTAAGRVEWMEGKGQVEYDDGRPVRMTSVCMLVTHRKEAELAKLAAAEEAARLKDDFLATLSHELRTPLNAILGWVQMLQTGGLTADHQRQAFDVIARSARLQAQLIEDILDVSRIITDKLDLDRQPVSIIQLIDSTLASIRPVVEARNITVDCRLPATLPTINGDPRRLQQVLANVLSNSVKFTPDGGRIEVDCRQDGATIAIDVHDSGAGIDPAFLPFIFDRFRQADRHSTRRHGGLGLGLSIARHLVERHDGTIRAESAGPGTGTTVKIRLPVRPVRSDEMSAGMEAARRPAARLDDLTVLVVDDETDSREVLAALLEHSGARVLQSDGGPSALSALRCQTVDVLVADLGMPGMDGFDLIRTVRRDGNRVPAIALSGYARPEDRAQALESGYDCHCAKPVDANDVLTTVRRLTNGG